MKALQLAQQVMQAPAPHPETVFLTVLALLVASASGLVSGITAWLTLFKRGKLKMTRPLMVGFTSRGDDGPKVIVRTTLFSSARQGNVIESLFVRITFNGTTTHTLHLWGFGDPPKFGSGLHVGQEGKAYPHHFLPSKDKPFEFSPGDAKVSLFARVVNGKSETLLFTETFKLTDEQVEASNGAGVVFNLEPESGRYYPSIAYEPLRLPLAAIGPEQLRVELMPMNAPGLLIERDTTFKLHYLIRIKNCAMFPMTPRELRLTFKAIGGGFEFEKSDVEVHHPFRELEPGAEQLIEYPLPTARLHDASAPPWVRQVIVGHIMAASPMWEGVLRESVSWHAIATVTDNRPGPKP